MNMNAISNCTTFANIGTEPVNRGLITGQDAEASTEQIKTQPSGRFDKFVRENQMGKQNDPAQEDHGPKRIGTMGMLEKICRREGPNGTCNHNDDTPGAYTERPIYA